MSEFVTLLGAEDVRSAGHSMTSAAQEFGRHVGFLIEELGGMRLTMEKLSQELRLLRESGRVSEEEDTDDPTPPEMLSAALRHIKRLEERLEEKE